MSAPRNTLPSEQLNFKNRLPILCFYHFILFAYYQVSTENLQKLQELKYLNLAINNIRKVENLDYCECLEKLDLTANFVDDLLSVASLAPNYNLKDLYVSIHKGLKIRERVNG